MIELHDGMPRLIQAGMGIYISNFRLANAASRLGALGVVSGVGLRHIVGEQIRAGDQEAIEIAKRFPVKQYVTELLSYAPGGDRYRKGIPMDYPDPERGALARRLSTICTYIEVMRAKKGHRGKVGVNVMWKCALTVLPTIYGSMIAGADALLCGAGVPMELPDIISKIQSGQDIEYSALFGTGTHVRLDISQDNSIEYVSKTPHLIPILSNFAFTKRILDVWEREYEGIKPFAFVLENHQAGGHNAPPRNKVDFTEQDDVEGYFDKVTAQGVRVYVAGAFLKGGTREEFLSWIEKGAYGIQVGSRFALSDESGMMRDLKDQVIELNAKDKTQVLTSKSLSPTGYPFKYVELPGTLSDEKIYQSRRRLCNRGYLLQSHFETLSDGSVKETYICPAMPNAQYKRLGGDPHETEDRICLCNCLFSTAGVGDANEPPLVTLGLNGKSIIEKQSARTIIEDILTPEYVAQMERELAE